MIQKMPLTAINDNFSVASLQADAVGIYVVAEYRRSDATLYMRSTLSNDGGTHDYATMRWDFFEFSGTTVVSTVNWTLTYDSNHRVSALSGGGPGLPVREVLGAHCLGSGLGGAGGTINGNLLVNGVLSSAHNVFDDGTGKSTFADFITMAGTIAAKILNSSITGATPFWFDQPDATTLRITAGAAPGAQGAGFVKIDSNGNWYANQYRFTSTLSPAEGSIPADTDAKTLIYDFGNGNWAGIGGFTSGLPWIRNGLGILDSTGRMFAKFSSSNGLNNNLGTVYEMLALSAGSNGNGSGNVMQLLSRLVRDATTANGDWTGVSFEIAQRTDVTEQHKIRFEPSGAIKLVPYNNGKLYTPNVVIDDGSGGSQFARMAISAAGTLTPPSGLSAGNSGSGGVGGNIVSGTIYKYQLTFTDLRNVEYPASAHVSVTSNGTPINLAWIAAPSGVQTIKIYKNYRYLASVVGSATSYQDNGNTATTAALPPTDWTSAATSIAGYMRWTGQIFGTAASTLNKVASVDLQTYTIIDKDARVYRAVYNDLAELFEKHSGVDSEPGDILVSRDGKVELSRGAYDKRVVGVHSDTFGFCLGGENKEAPSENYDRFVPIGISGRVYIKVAGGIEEGDLITTSHIPRVGMKANHYIPGTIVGKALESIPNDGSIRRVWALIMSI